MHSSAHPLHLKVLRSCEGRTYTVDEIASREERVHLHFTGGQVALWACPVDLESLALGHVLLDCLHQGQEDAPAPRPLSLHAAQCQIKKLPASQGEHAFMVELSATTSTAAASPPAEPGTATAAQIIAHMDTMLKQAGLWDGTGCFHRAAMVHLPTGCMVALSEDIGRHNCLDRLAGICALRGLDPAAHALCITARITASLYAKARRAGFAFIVSRAAVTSASVQLAMEQKVTLVGYCRSADQRCTVFADQARRVLTEECHG